MKTLHCMVRVDAVPQDPCAADGDPDLFTPDPHDPIGVDSGDDVPDGAAPPAPGPHRSSAATDLADGMRRDFPPSSNGVDAPRLVVFEVINLKPLKGEVPWSRLHE